MPMLADLLLGAMAEIENAIISIQVYDDVLLDTTLDFIYYGKLQDADISCREECDKFLNVLTEGNDPNKLDAIL